MLGLSCPTPPSFQVHQRMGASEPMKERIAELEKEILEHQAVEAEQKERIADLLSDKPALEKQREEIARLAEDLAVARDQAEDSARTKSEFLANMSHELRTPLNAIIGFAELIGGEMFGPVGSSSYREYANHIRESGLHLLDLINDILDLSKFESGSDELHEESIEISELTRSVRWLVTARAEDDNVELETELGDNLPMLCADKLKLKQILINLLSNAIKFTDTGGKVTLKAWCSVNGGYVFQVIDTGIGIALEDIPKALLPFQQIDNGLNRRYEGSGLGLPFSKSLVEMHGGSLDLQSLVGVGTTVTVRFPAERIVRSPRDTKIVDTDDRKAG